MERAQMSREALAERVETFLGEFRIVIPALAALLGFQLQVAFSIEYSRLPPPLRVLNFASVVSTSAALLFLLIPTSYHRYTRHVEASEAFLDFARRNISVAFAFVAFSIASSLGLQAHRTFGNERASLVVGALAFVVLVVGWFVFPRAHYARTHRA